MFLGDGQGTAVFVAGREEGGLQLLPPFTPNLLCQPLCRPQAGKVEELHLGLRMNVDYSEYQMGK